MRKLIVEQWMSLDGYVTDKEGSLDFFTNLTPDQNKYSDTDQLKFLETVDTILLGRKTYDLFVDFWPNANIEQEVIADKLNSINKIVFSNTLTKASWGKWNNAAIISGDAANEIQELKSKPGKDMVMWGSISLAQLLMTKNLVDEYRIQLCPIVTGGGRSLFHQQMDRTQLKLKEIRHYDTGTAFLNYMVIR